MEQCGDACFNGGRIFMSIADADVIVEDQVKFYPVGAAGVAVTEVVV